MKILSLLLALTLSAQSQGQTQQLARQHLPPWSKKLISVAIASGLLLSSPVMAQELPLNAQFTTTTRAEHLSVLNLMFISNGRQRSGYFAYVGQDPQNRALLLGLRLSVTIIPFVEAELVINADGAETLIFNHEGLALRTAAVEEKQAFLRPDVELARLYDMTLLALDGLTTQDYHAVQVGAFPPTTTPLDIVVYRTDLLLDPGKDVDWVAVYSNAPLAQEKCVATSFTPELWSANGNCTTGRFAVSTTAPIFTADDGELVAFAFSATEMIVIPPEVQTYVQEALAINSTQKLSTTWGAIKKRGAH